MLKQLLSFPYHGERRQALRMMKWILSPSWRRKGEKQRAAQMSKDSFEPSNKSMQLLVLIAIGLKKKKQTKRAVWGMHRRQASSEFRHVSHIPRQGLGKQVFRSLQAPRNVKGRQNTNTPTAGRSANESSYTS